MAVFFKTVKIMRNSLHWMLDDGEQASISHLLMRVWKQTLL